VADRVARRRPRDSFRVVALEAEDNQELYAVVAPTGVALYTFTDIREATEEAAALNVAHASGRGSSEADRGERKIGARPPE
jgi:hypothetical protein